MANPNKKIIISIEANEFGGKSTVAKALVEKLNSLGLPNINAKYARLPGTSPIGEQLRPIVKTGNTSALTDLGLALAGHSACYDYLSTSEEYKDASVIVLDRNLESILVYQGFIGKLALIEPNILNQTIATLRDKLLQDYHLVRIFLDCNVDVLEARRAMTNAHDRNAPVDDKYDNVSKERLSEMCEYYKIAFSDRYDSLFGGQKLILNCNLPGATVDAIVDAIIGALQPKQPVQQAPQTEVINHTEDELPKPTVKVNEDGTVVTTEATHNE